MILFKHFEVSFCLFDRHLVPHDFKDTLKHRSRHNVDKFFWYLRLTLIFKLDHLHKLVGILRLDLNQMVHKVLELRSVRSIQQKLKFFKMAVHTVQDFIHPMLHIASHLSSLLLFVHRMKVLLCPQENPGKFLGRRFHDRPKQPFLTAKSGIDRSRGRIRLRRNRAKRSIRIALFQKFRLCTGKNLLGNSFYWFCHSTSVTVLCNTVINIILCVVAVKRGTEKIWLSLSPVSENVSFEMTGQSCYCHFCSFPL